MEEQEGNILELSGCESKGFRKEVLMCWAVLEHLKAEYNFKDLVSQVHSKIVEQVQVSQKKYQREKILVNREWALKLQVTLHVERAHL